MAVDDPTRIDLVATRPGSNVVRLVVTDHLAWDDLDAHLELLQDKINAYIGFVESGQLQRLTEPRVPDDPDVEIFVAAKHEPPRAALDSLHRLERAVADLGLRLIVQVGIPNRGHAG